MEEGAERTLFLPGSRRIRKDSDRAAVLFILDTRGTREGVIGKARNAVIERSRSNASRSVSPGQLHSQRYGYTYRSFIDRDPGRNVSVVRLRKKPVETRGNVSFPQLYPSLHSARGGMVRFVARRRSGS